MGAPCPGATSYRPLHLDLASLQTIVVYTVGRLHEPSNRNLLGRIVATHPRQLFPSLLVRPAEIMICVIRSWSPRRVVPGVAIGPRHRPRRAGERVLSCLGDRCWTAC